MIIAGGPFSGKTTLFKRLLKTGTGYVETDILRTWVYMQDGYDLVNKDHDLWKAWRIDHPKHEIWKQSDKKLQAIENKLATRKDILLITHNRRAKYWLWRPGLDIGASAQEYYDERGEEAVSRMTAGLAWAYDALKDPNPHELLTPDEAFEKFKGLTGDVTELFEDKNWLVKTLAMRRTKSNKSQDEVMAKANELELPKNETDAEEELKPKAFPCPHCGKTTIAHYHQKDGKDVACLECMKASQEQYEKDKQSPESQKHNKPGKDHATWPGDWPFSNEADLARQKREKKATGILRFGPVRPSIDPNPMNKDGNPYKETIWTVPFTEDQLLMKVQEEMWEALNAKNKMEFIYEWLDNVFFLELAMMEGPESLKEKIKQCSDYQGMKNLKRGRQPLPVIRTALNMPLNEVDNTDQFEREFLTKPEGGTMDQEKEKKELSKPLEMGVQPAEQESSEPTGGPDEKPEVVTPENKDKVDEEEKERKQPKGDESGLFAKPQTQTFGLKQRTGMSGKKFEI